MPIRPENRDRYPKDWHMIRQRILQRADRRCEGSPQFPDCRAEQYMLHPVTGSRVVLTIGHLDHQPENCAEDNLRAWCQRCHLAYDAEHHAETAYRTRRQRKAVDMFECNCPEKTCQPKQNEGRYCWRSGEPIPVGYFPENAALTEAERLDG